MPQQPADYRKRAEECVRLAQTVRTPQQRVMLLHIAETWVRLAEDAAENPASASAQNPASAPALN